MADEASGSERNPAAARALVAFVVAFPGEFRDRPAVAGIIADIEPGGERDEAHLAFLALERDEGGTEEVDRLVVPHIHLHDAPLALEGCGQRRELLFRITPPPRSASAGARDCRRLRRR